MRDLHNNVDVVRLLDAVLTAPTIDRDGDVDVDTRGYNSCEIVVSVGVSGDTLAAGLNVSLELEDSEDDSTYSDVADAQLLGATGGGSGQFALINDPAEDATVYRVGYVGGKRYVRLKVNVTGTHTNGIPIAAVALLGRERHTGGPAV